MRTGALISLAVSAAIALGLEAHAQAPAPTAVPDAMPFDVPYGASIGADRASEVVKAVIAEATKAPRNWKLAVAVVDSSGHLVYFYKIDQTQIASLTVAIQKAHTAAVWRRPTSVFFEAMQTSAGSNLTTLQPTPAASSGGIPLIEGGKIIGAIGCSGATGAQDAVACKAGADTIK